MALSPEQMERYTEMKLCLAGLEALQSWERLPMEAQKRPDALRLAEMGWELLSKEKDIAMIALHELAMSAMWARRTERPWALQWVIEKGYAPGKMEVAWNADRNGDLERWGRSREWEAPVAHALSAGAMECAKVWARAGFAKEGVPDLAADKERSRAWVAELKAKSVKGRREALKAKNALRWGLEDIGWLAEKLSSTHPILLAWKSQVSHTVKWEPEDVSVFLKTASEPPFGYQEEWGHPWFDAAAAALAIKGSSMALEACQRAGVKPDADPLWWEDASRQLFWSWLSAQKNEGLTTPDEDASRERKKESLARVMGWIDESFPGQHPSSRMLGEQAVAWLEECSGMGKGPDWDRQAKWAIQLLRALKDKKDPTWFRGQEEKLQSKLLELKEKNKKKADASLSKVCEVLEEALEEIGPLARGQKDAPKKILRC